MPSSQPSDQHPDQYDASKYPPVFAAVDLAVFTIRNGAFSVLLIERGDEPFRGHWALPGGFIEPHEDAEAAAWRELVEETGVDRSIGVHLEQLRTYSDPGRDPRHRIISVAHVAFAPNLPEPQAGSDAANARWWAVEDVLYRLGPIGSGKSTRLYTDLSDGVLDEYPRLAFDHAVILADAIERVRSKIEYTTLATQFVTEPFTLAELRRVYAAVWGTEPDPANFRRKVLSTPGFVVATRDKGHSESGGPRPTLYRRGPAVLLQPAMLRPDAETA